jgi:CRISPR system Cascade subunit CasD
MNAVLIEMRGPLASWSDGGVVYRPTDMAPTWSAIVGLIGAAFGWFRDDERLLQLAADYAPAFEVKNPSQRFVDYHTIQTPHAAALGGVPPANRADELERGKKPDGDPHTSITRREYVSDVQYTIGVFGLVDQSFLDADDIARAIQAPKFPLYLGRKCCTPTHLAAIPASAAATVDTVMRPTHWDERLPCMLKPLAIRERRDLPIQLLPRRFALRKECIV